MPARHVSRAALGAVVIAGGAALAVLGLPAAGQSVGASAVDRPAQPGGPDAGRPNLLAAPSPSAPTAPPRSPSPVASPTTASDAPTEADREAGVLRRAVTESGSGEFDVAPGSVPAPGPGAGTAPGATSNSPLPVGATVRRRTPASRSAAVGASPPGVELGTGVEGAVDGAVDGVAEAGGDADGAVSSCGRPAAGTAAPTSPGSAAVAPTDCAAAGRPSTARAAPPAITTAPSTARDTSRAGTR